MLNNEVKKILQEQFSQEANYQKIMKNVNKKQKAYSKILKIALLPTCAALLATIIIPNMCNKSIEFNQDIAKTNIAKNITTINKDEQIQIAKEKIYKTIEGGEQCWAYDPTIAKNLINDYPESKSVVRVKVLSVGEGKMLPKQENFYCPFTCFTPIRIQIEDNLMNNNQLNGTITTYMEGGKIKIANILKATPQEIEYMGIYDTSQVDPEQYIEYKWADSYYELNIGDEYVMIINKTNPNLYQIFCGGYGIFKVEKSNDGTETYRNVISGKLY